MKKPVYLFFRDPLECVQSIMESPLVTDHLKFIPFRAFKTAEKIMWIYTEWLTGDHAWMMQVRFRHDSLEQMPTMSISMNFLQARHYWALSCLQTRQISQ